jgi:YfiH family protein
MWLHAPNITCTHGFSDRLGGVSPKPYDTLNLAGSGDDPVNIAQNRKRALAHLNLSEARLCLLKQVHGTSVCRAREGSQEGDAIVTRTKNMAIAVGVADCFPVLFYDKQNEVIGAAHSGWKGTVGRIVANTVNEMRELGARAGNIKVAIGQGISYADFEVGNEVIERFSTAGFPKELLTGNRIDLAGCIKHTLIGCGISPGNIWYMNRSSKEDEFFSHRRDKGVTGRNWGLIAL